LASTRSRLPPGLAFSLWASTEAVRSPTRFRYSSAHAAIKVRNMRPRADAGFMPVPPMSPRCRAIPALSHAFVWHSASSASRKSRSSTHTIPVDKSPSHKRCGVTSAFRIQLGFREVDRCPPIDLPVDRFFPANYSEPPAVSRGGFCLVTLISPRSAGRRDKSRRKEPGTPLRMLRREIPMALSRCEHCGLPSKSPDPYTDRHIAASASGRQVRCGG